jgi:DNA replication factor GINS
MMQQDNEMSFEDLSSAYRIEMKSQMLADARKDLYHAMRRLQESIQNDYEREYSKDPDSIICEGINERRKKANLLMEKVADLRTEKVMMMALRGSMGASNILDKLTQEEREYYDAVACESKKHRNAILKERRRSYVIPDIAPETGTDDPAPVWNESVPKGIENEGEELIENPRNNADEEREERIMIRILEDLPMIAGPDRDYDLKREDIVSMPVTLANVLINHEKAALLNVTP